MHRAGVIINYDIPYNPTRVIQRVGRINRIGKKLFDKIYIHNFIPRLEAQKDIKNWQIANFKLTLINAIFGNDTKILQKDEDIDSLLSTKREAEILDDDDKSWDIEYRNIYNKLKGDEKLLEKIKKLEDGIFTQREKNFDGLLEIRRGKNGILTGLLKDSIMDYSVKNAFEILKAESLLGQFERRKNIKKINHKPDALLKLEKYKGLMQFEISSSDREYIEKIIKGIEYNQFSQPKIKDIEKAFKNNKDIEILKAIKNIIGDSDIENINYAETDFWEESKLIAREEFFKINGGVK